MEDELKCPSCRQFFVQPVLLPCFHAMCLGCAMQNQQPVVVNNLAGHPSSSQNQQDQPLPPPPTELQLLSELQCNDCNDSDQLSILSETDSGVVVSSSGSSRPSSYIHPATATTTAAATISLSCPVTSCHKIVYFDEHGAQNLPRYRAMQTIVEKFTESSNRAASAASSTPCQLCPEEPGQQEASVFCQQCQVFYCDRCRENCHPARGPLAKHSLISPSQGRLALRSLKEKFKVCLLFLSFFLFFPVKSSCYFFDCLVVRADREDFVKWRAHIDVSFLFSTGARYYSNVTWRVREKEPATAVDRRGGPFGALERAVADAVAVAEGIRL